ncbi:hypothetical protein AM588_10001527 [Phytophthora nicotianae]|uniref:DNA-directed RNA polymerase subunit n=1 Tax=Phytophthora nicotianae TaxID=4792 RepID=A0A0W8CTM2_PHYNI|nr:hypothetical protein AM588_10001527 [Phytophthora nicotianae]
MSTEFFASSATSTGPAFCPHCGTILDHPDTNSIRGQADTQVAGCREGHERSHGPARATVEETCPKCGNPEMDYYTLQLRSADEGQTVFYECKKCGHKFSVNN